MWHLPDSSLCHPQSWLHPTLICHMIVKQPSLATRSMGILIHALSDAAAAKSLQSCPTVYDPMDWSPPGFSVHGILQARTLEWVAIIELEYHNFAIPNDTKIKVIIINAAKTIGWRTERELDKLCWGLGHPHTKEKQPESWTLPAVHSTHRQLPSSDQPQSN